MKVKVTTVPEYDIEIEGIKLGRFTQQGEAWNSMIKLQNAKGYSVIISKDNTGLFENLFASTQLFGSGEATLISASPDIWLALKVTNDAIKATSVDKREPK